MAYAPEPQQMGNPDDDGTNVKIQKVVPADPQGIGKCIFNLPCIGGCCAPTVNPDQTCARRGSNEFTLPASGAYLKLAPVIEYSPCCIFCGRLGLGYFARNRSNVMCFAFIVSLTGWILTAISAIALSSEPGVVSGFGHWATGEFVVEATDDTVMKIYIGVSTRVEEVDCALALNTTVCMQNVLASPGFTRSHADVYIRGTDWNDDTRCGAAPPVMTAEVSSAMSAVGTIICGECKKNAQASQQLLILALITQIPQMTTDLQRRTSFGDVNCQATMGAVTSVFGCLSTLSSLMAFATACFRGLPEDIPGLDTIKMRWNFGRALRCLGVATVFKLIDAALHVLTPTPRARWRKPPAGVENLEEFLMLGA